MHEKYQCINFYFFMADILEVHTDGMQANSIQTYFALRHHKCKQKPNRKIFWDNFQFLYQTSLKLPKYSKPVWNYQLKSYNSDWSSYELENDLVFQS